MPKPAVPTTPQDLEAWLTERVAFYLECPADEIDPHGPFPELGLDSIYALTLCGDIEDALGLVVAPVVTWDHPTVVQLAAHLREELNR
ncbi:acyl carrier protein [Kitasatospora sp. NPDC097643]|uniref:acyl carrier protein n=1 Tax=Kitasatospora sp. NPDC097643 TaxID=3157230 RepID=UPI003333DF4B